MAEETEQKEEDQLKKMAEFRTVLERRMKEMEIELEGLRAMLDFLNTALVEKGFRRAQIVKPSTVPIEDKIPSRPMPVTVEAEVSASSVLEHEQAIPIKTPTGDLLANLYMSEDLMRVVVAEDKRFTVDTPPFMAFLVERVLTKMEEKDREGAGRGEIEPDKILSYKIIRDGDLLKEITVRNMGSDRARELKSTIRWTLEKMYEKMKTSA